MYAERMTEDLEVSVKALLHKSLQQQIKSYFYELCEANNVPLMMDGMSHEQKLSVQRMELQRDIKNMGISNSITANVLVGLDKKIKSINKNYLKMYDQKVELK